MSILTRTPNVPFALISRFGIVVFVVALGFAISILAVFVGLPALPASASLQQSSVPAFDHIFVVIEENHGYDEIIGNSDAPYINSLASKSAVATDYSDIGHPSLVNYLALTGGSTFGISSDCPVTACSVDARNLADTIEASGRSWGAYMESMPSPCYTDHSGDYTPRHNPFVYYRDITSNAVRCDAHVLPYSALSPLLLTTATTPNFVWITPNTCNDMHDCPVSTADAWLANNLPGIFNSPAWTGQNSVLFLLWDEGKGHRVPALIIGSAVKPGYRSSVSYTHYSSLRTVEAAWGLPALTQNDAGATIMLDVWK